MSTAGGVLITLEGLDGSGKTTAWDALAEAYPDATLTREPTRTWYGDAVRRSLGTPEADPLAELFLYTADHAHHLAETVRPALGEDGLVISDRYSDSRFAYQAASLGGLLEEPLAFVRKIHEPWSRPPDATIYLDVPPEVGAVRSAGANKFEQVQFLERVHDHYERLIEAEPDRFVRIDADRDRDAVIEDVLAAADAIVG